MKNYPCVYYNCLYLPSSCLWKLLLLNMRKSSMSSMIMFSLWAVFFQQFHQWSYRIRLGILTGILSKILQGFIRTFASGIVLEIPPGKKNTPKIISPKILQRTICVVDCSRNYSNIGFLEISTGILFRNIYWHAFRLEKPSEIQKIFQKCLHKFLQTFLGKIIQTFFQKLHRKELFKKKT